MPKAKTVIDVILGEAASGTREERYADMLGVASTIVNRSDQLGVSVDDVARVQKEFNAYGKELPDGVGAYRQLAEQAMRQVLENGPVHDATFYATPAAVKNLPEGLQFETETTGHRYFSDPQNRSVRTTQGYKRPSMRSRLPDEAPLPVFRSESVGASQGLLGRPLESGGAPAHPSADESHQHDLDGIVSFSNSGSVRDMPITDSMRSYLATAVSEVYGPGYTAKVYSGGQHPKGMGKRVVDSSPRHDHGKAADVYVYDPDGKQVRGDGLAPLGQYWAAKKIGGVGLEMKGGGIHLDEWSTPPPGGAMHWDYSGPDDGGRYTRGQRRALQAGLAGNMPELAAAVPRFGNIKPAPRPGEVPAPSDHAQNERFGHPALPSATLPPQIDPSSGKEFYRDPDLPFVGVGDGTGSIFPDPGGSSLQPGAGGPMQTPPPPMEEMPFEGTGKGGRLVGPGRGGRLIAPTKGGRLGHAAPAFTTLPPEIDPSHGAEFFQDPGQHFPETTGGAPAIYSDAGPPSPQSGVGQGAPARSPDIAPPLDPMREGLIPIPQSRPVMEPDWSLGEPDRQGMHRPPGNGIGGLLDRGVGGLLGSMMAGPAGAVIGGLLGDRMDRPLTEHRGGDENYATDERVARRLTGKTRKQRQRDHDRLSDRAKDRALSGPGGLY